MEKGSAPRQRIEKGSEESAPRPRTLLRRRSSWPRRQKVHGKSKHVDNHTTNNESNRNRMEDEDARHKREEQERRAKRKVRRDQSKDGPMVDPRDIIMTYTHMVFGVSC